MTDLRMVNIRTLPELMCCFYKKYGLAALLGRHNGLTYGENASFGADRYIFHGT